MKKILFAFIMLLLSLSNTHAGIQDTIPVNSINITWSGSEWGKYIWTNSARQNVIDQNISTYWHYRDWGGGFNRPHAYTYVHLYLNNPVDINKVGYLYQYYLTNNYYGRPVRNDYFILVYDLKQNKWIKVINNQPFLSIYTNHIFIRHHMIVWNLVAYESTTSNLKIKEILLFGESRIGLSDDTPLIVIDNDAPITVARKTNITLSLIGSTHYRSPTEDSSLVVSQPLIAFPATVDTFNVSMINSDIWDNFISGNPINLNVSGGNEVLTVSTNGNDVTSGQDVGGIKTKQSFSRDFTLEYKFAVQDFILSTGGVVKTGTTISSDSQGQGDRIELIGVSGEGVSSGFAIIEYINGISSNLYIDTKPFSATGQFQNVRIEVRDNDTITVFLDGDEIFEAPIH